MTKSQNEERNVRNNVDIPDDLAISILSKLPIKSLKLSNFMLRCLMPNLELKLMTTHVTWYCTYFKHITP